MSTLHGLEPDSQDNYVCFQAVMMIHYLFLVLLKVSVNRG